MSKFSKRAYGCVIIKSINSNYNADFTHQPRTLPDGKVYATDKALKYFVRNYLIRETAEKIFYYKTLKEDTLNPRSLDETYENYFGQIPEGEGKGAAKEASKKKQMLSNLLKCLDVRLFGGTYAGSTNLSMHGPVQFTHGINQFVRGEIYSEQIMSPFRNPGEEGSKEKGASTLGTQSKLREGHYVHSLSVNPKNLESLTDLSGTDNYLSKDDIEKLKLGLRKGASYYDSSAKAGTDNELLVWVELKESSKLVLPSFVELVKVNEQREIDLAGLKDLIAQSNVKSEIEKIEIYLDKTITKIVNKPEGTVELDL